jgi:hypothetical protein
LTLSVKRTAFLCVCSTMSQTVCRETTDLNLAVRTQQEGIACLNTETIRCLLIAMSSFQQKEEPPCVCSASTTCHILDDLNRVKLLFFTGDIPLDNIEQSCESCIVCLQHDVRSSHPVLHPIDASHLSISSSNSCIHASISWTN